ncbi:MAG: hypothetical protein KGN84_03415 [Acidobacteriota bacterium]|nr:hypothetical protein [Acidobacteriota bacterium]
MNLGAEPKKVATLAAIVVLGGAFAVYENLSDDTPSSSGSPHRIAAPNPAPPRVAPRPAERRRIGNQSLLSDWKPRLGPKNPEDRPDPNAIDPAVRLDLLARVQAVAPVEAGRNLFVFGQAPPPPGPIPTLPKNTPKIAVNHPPATAPGSPAGPVAPPKPTAPPMTFKYYGFKVSKSDGHKAAFLLDGEDILIAGENDTIKQKRYKIVRIGVTSIVIEDTQFKSTQTLPLTENLAG